MQCALRVEVDNQIAIARAGAIPVLVELLRTSTVAAVKEHAAGALKNLAANGVYRHESCRLSCVIIDATCAAENHSAIRDCDTSGLSSIL